MYKKQHRIAGVQVKGWFLLLVVSWSVFSFLFVTSASAASPSTGVQFTMEIQPGPLSMSVHDPSPTAVSQEGFVSVSEVQIVDMRAEESPEWDLSLSIGSCDDTVIVRTVLTDDAIAPTTLVSDHEIEGSGTVSLLMSQPSAVPGRSTVQVLVAGSANDDLEGTFTIL